MENEVEKVNLVTFYDTTFFSITFRVLFFYFTFPFDLVGYVRDVDYNY